MFIFIGNKHLSLTENEEKQSLEGSTYCSVLLLSFPIRLSSWADLVFNEHSNRDLF